MLFATEVLHNTLATDVSRVPKSHSRAVRDPEQYVPRRAGLAETVSVYESWTRGHSNFWSGSRGQF